MATWTIDTVHSSIEFGVRHLGIATVKGRFSTFSGTIETGDDGVPTSVLATIDANSIDTNNAQRDGHVRSADILDVAAYPEIVFKSTSIVATTPGETHPHRFEVSGELTLHGVTKPIEFHADVVDPITDPWTKQRIAAEITGTINRNDYGVTLSTLPLINGILSVGEDIAFQLHLQAIS